VAKRSVDLEFPIYNFCIEWQRAFAASTYPILDLYLESPTSTSLLPVAEVLTLSDGAFTYPMQFPLIERWTNTALRSGAK
jgi:hypothetical protein